MMIENERGPTGIKPWRADDIDPIEELARIINEAQERDTRDERRFDDLARLARPKPIKAAAQHSSRVRRSSPLSDVRDYGGRRGGM
jgi:hypothetical protein